MIAGAPASCGRTEAGSVVTMPRARDPATSRPPSRPGNAWFVRPALQLLLILGTGGFLRLWALGAVGFNSDEAVYAGQAASIAGDPALSSLFPIFRAHPLLFQTLLSLGFVNGVSDTGARILSVAFGLATIVVVYLLGKLLYGQQVGMVAALFLAVMPYHVVVSRQVLLDGPETFFAVVALYCVGRFCVDRTSRWLYAGAAVMGLTLLTKEVAAILVIALFVFFVLRREFRVSRRALLISGGILFGVIAAYPLSTALSGRSSTGRSYLLWQLFRPANHSLWFYGQTVAPALGLAVLVLAVAGVWFLRQRDNWREVLLGCWITVPLVFFQFWPVKGYQYLLAIAPALAVLAARTVVLGWVPGLARWSSAARHTRIAVVLAVGASLVVPSWHAVNPAATATFLAGSGGVPAGREAGEWVDANIPQGATVLTVGPSMANLIQFYGHRKALALSVSPNPLSRNPSYQPVDNPDRQLRGGDLQYIVWDGYSAARSPFFSARLLHYVQKYNGVAVHTETLTVPDPDGRATPKSMIIVYEVRP